MKRKFLSISCCFFLSLSLICCSQVKSSLDGNDTSIITSASDNTSISSQDETLINDALSVDESTLQDSESTTNVSTSTISENPKENTNTSSAIEKILLLKTYLLLKTLVTHHKHVDYSFIIPLTEEDIM